MAIEFGSDGVGHESGKSDKRTINWRLIVQSVAAHCARGVVSAAAVSGADHHLQRLNAADPIGVCISFRARAVKPQQSKHG